MLKRVGTVLLFFSFFLLFCVQTGYSQTNNVNREHEAIIIEGKLLDVFDGVPIGELFLYSYDSQTGTFTQIPFQIDEKGEMPDPNDPTEIDTSYFFPDDGLIDFNDEIAFMASDLGDRDPQMAPGHWISDPNSMTHPRLEISATDVLGSSTPNKAQGLSQGWVYLFRSNTLSQEFTEDYVTYTPPPGSNGDDIVTAQTYTMTANSKGFFADIFLPNAPTVDLLDRQKIRGKTNFILLPTFDEENPNHFSFKSVQAIDGPVRVIRELILDFIGLLDAELPTQYFRSFALLTGDLNIPQNLSGIAITEIRHSIDLSTNAIGMTFTNSFNATPVAVDGVIDNVNTTLEKTPQFDHTHITGSQGTIVSLFTVPGTIGSSQDLFYQDELNIGDPGDGNSIGDTGIIITGNDIEGQFPLSLRFVFLDPNQPSSVADQLVNFEENPLAIDTLSQTFDQVVPVELASFTAAVEGNDVQLVWVTSSETNNFGFDVERKLHEAETIWQKIGFVQGNGTTTNEIRYEFLDENLPPGTYNYRLKQIDTDGSFEYSPILNVVVGMPETFALHQNFPNPFNPSTTISYEIPANIADSEIPKTTLKIYDLLGAEVRTLVDEEQASGFYSVIWNGKNSSGFDVPSGVYIYKLTSGKFTDTKKMLLVK